LETVRAGDLVFTLSNATGGLAQGRNTFQLEFRSASSGALVDVGTVELAASMAMPGMVMSSPVTVTPAGRAGVYNVTAELGMSGSWQMSLEWRGPTGGGSANFEGNVQ
jgi:hypothetical protein